MAERRRLPSTEPPTLSSSPPAKKSKHPKNEGEQVVEEEEEGKERFDEIDAVEESLETNERLSLESSSGHLESNIKNLEAEEEPVPGTSIDETDGFGRMIMGRRTDVSSFVGEHAHYQELSLIGDGAYGTVYKAKDLSSGHVVALKKVRIPLTEDGLPTSTLREIAGLKQLERFEHPNIVRLLDVCQGNYLQFPGGNNEQSGRLDRGLILWLVFEHVDRDLASFISTCPSTGISPHLIRQMSKDILLGVDFLHTNRIIHRDLKPHNLLVTREGRIKIADFGLAKTYDFEMKLTSLVVTLWYRAPEVLLGCPYATPVDLWSVGCILAELDRLRAIFPGTSEGDQLDRIFQILGTPSREEWPKNVSLSWTAFPHREATPFRTVIPRISDAGLDLITNMLTFNPHIRLTAAQALRHTYFTSES